MLATLPTICYNATPVSRARFITKRGASPVLNKNRFKLMPAAALLGLSLLLAACGDNSTASTSPAASPTAVTAPMLMPPTTQATPTTSLMPAPNSTAGTDGNIPAPISTSGVGNLPPSNEQNMP